METWHWWLIAAIVLMIAEVLTTDFLLATFGLACLAASTAAGFGVGLIAQLSVFVITASISLAVVRPAAKRWLYQSTDTAKMNSEGLIGRRGTVVDEVGGEESPGRVKLGGEEWRAVSGTGKPLSSGTVVHVTALDGATLTVHPGTP